MNNLETERIQAIYKAVITSKTVKEVAAKVGSLYTGEPITPAALRQYLGRKRLRIETRPVLLTQEGNVFCVYKTH